MARLFIKTSEGEEMKSTKTREFVSVDGELIIITELGTIVFSKKEFENIIKKLKGGKNDRKKN